jgi:hypothetical protein
VVSSRARERAYFHTTVSTHCDAVGFDEVVFELSQLDARTSLFFLQPSAVSLLLISAFAPQGLDHVVMFGRSLYQP